MTWNNFKDQQPTYTDTFLVTVAKPNPRGYGLSTFVVKAYFDSESKQWHKYDPFLPDGNVQEEITKFVRGWMEEPGPLI